MPMIKARAENERNADDQSKDGSLIQSQQKQIIKIKTEV